MKEIWKSIVGYEGYYEVSNSGRIKSLTRTETYFHATAGKLVSRTRQGRMMELKEDRYGYMTVHLRMDGSSKHCTVHRLVAEAFIPNAFNKSTVNHKNCDKKDNSLCNLEWATVSEQTKHAYDNGLIKHLKPVVRAGEAHYLFKTPPEIVSEILRLRGEGNTLTKIAESLGLGTSTVCRIIRREM